MRRRVPTLDQLDLLTWSPPQPVAQFPADQVRASSVGGRVCRAVSLALQGHKRLVVAEAMSAYLGETVSPHMLDAYASVARDEHNISVVRFVALIAATNDRRLLELIAEMFGWAVVPRKFLAAIQLAALQEQEETLRRQRKVLRRQARSEGAL